MKCHSWPSEYRYCMSVSIDVGGLDRLVRLERALYDAPGLEVPDLGARERLALAGLDELVAHDRVRVAVEHDLEPALEFVRGVVRHRVSRSRSPVRGGTAAPPADGRGREYIERFPAARRGATTLGPCPRPPASRRPVPRIAQPETQEPAPPIACLVAGADGEHATRLTGMLERSARVGGVERTIGEVMLRHAMAVQHRDLVVVVLDAPDRPLPASLMRYPETRVLVVAPDGGARHARALAAAGGRRPGLAARRGRHGARARPARRRVRARRHRPAPGRRRGHAATAHRDAHGAARDDRRRRGAALPC